MKNEDGYEIYTNIFNFKDMKKFKKECKKIGAIDENGNIDLSKYIEKQGGHK